MTRTIGQRRESLVLSTDFTMSDTARTRLIATVLCQAMVAIQQEMRRLPGRFMLLCGSWPGRSVAPVAS
jgi:hypothetical protein